MGPTLIFYMNESVHDNLQLWSVKIYGSCEEDHRSSDSSFIESF